MTKTSREDSQALQQLQAAIRKLAERIEHTGRRIDKIAHTEEE